MAYVNPEGVISPKGNWKLKRVLYNSAQKSRQGGWSVAEGEWDGDPVIGVRWNGSDSEEGVGNPQSRGFPTWFIVPDGLRDVVMQKVEFMKQEQNIVTCKIYRPDDYEHGAWRVEAKLGEGVSEKLRGILVFDLPDLPNRMCHPEREYKCAVDGKLRGSFKEGTWLGDVYSNGIAEDDNPTTIDVVREVFTENVMRAVQQREVL